jgi:hypothetical protein
MTHSSRQFYVYAFLRNKDSGSGPKYSPYYIGKGCGKRAFEKYGRSIPLPKDNAFIVFIEQRLTESEAFNLEKYCIKLFGRVDIGTGILHNLTDGGEGPAGMIMSKETRRKMSLSRQGTKHPLWGEPRSEAVKSKISAAMSGHKHRCYGLPMPEETKAKISKANKGKPKTQQHRASLARANCRYEYLIVSPTGEQFIITNLNAFCKENGLERSTMRKAIKGKRLHKGWSGSVLREINDAKA